MKIAVCEDDQEDSRFLTSMICDFLSAHAIEAQIKLYSRGEDFIAAHAQEHYDIVFMDIYLSGISGLDAAAIADSQVPVQTIFTTASKEHAIEAFSLNAAHYLTKPLEAKDVAQALERCLSKLSIRYSEILEIKTSRGMVSVPINNILYIEVFNKVCYIHTHKSSLRTYSSLDAIFELINSDTFIRAQRSFLVNMNYIESFYFDRIILSDGKNVVLSRANRARLKDQYQQFLFRLAREGKI
jgi:two-component system response regulator LytT